MKLIKSYLHSLAPDLSAMSDITAMALPPIVEVAVKLDESTEVDSGPFDVVDVSIEEKLYILDNPVVDELC